MALSFWSWPLNDANTAALLHIFLPFVVGFFASRLIYGWIKKAGLQAADFSPMVASFLTAPLLACAYYILATKDFIRGDIGNLFHRLSSDLVLFGPIILVLLPLLTIYLWGKFPRKKMIDVTLCASAVVVVISEFVWLSCLVGDGS